MAIIRYGSPMMHWQHEINRLFDDFDRAFEGGVGVEQEANGGMFRPAVDVREEKDAYTVHVEVPGVPRENMEIAMHDGSLLIRGRKEARKESGDSQFRRVERSYGSFTRLLQLPRGIDAENISANLSDGVLEVRLPKLSQSQPRRIAIGTTREVEAQSSSPQQEDAQPTSHPVPEPAPQPTFGQAEVAQAERIADQQGDDAQDPLADAEAQQH